MTASAAPTGKNYYCSCVSSDNNIGPGPFPPPISPPKAPRCVSNPAQYQCGIGETQSCGPSDCTTGTAPIIWLNHMGIVTYLLPVNSSNCTFPQLTPYVFNNLSFDEPLEIGLGTNPNEKCGLKFGLIGVSGWEKPNYEMLVEWKSINGDPELCEGQGKHTIPITFIKQGTPTIDITKVSFTKPFFLSGGSRTGECSLVFSLKPTNPPGFAIQGLVGFTGAPASCGGTTGKEPSSQLDTIAFRSIGDRSPVQINFKHSAVSESSCRLRLGL